MGEEREFDEISKFARELGVQAGLGEEFMSPFLQKLSQDREVSAIMHSTISSPTGSR